MNEYQSRLLRLQHKMKQNDIDGCIAAQNVDIYYLTGSMQTGYVFIPMQGDPIYYVKRSIVRAEEESAVRVKPLGSFRSFAERLEGDFPYIFQLNPQPVIATEFDTLPVQIYQRFLSIFPKVRWTDSSTMVREVRMIKSSYEISRIREAAQVVDHALQEALKYVAIGMTELEFIAKIEYHLRLNGHIGIMRMRGFNQELITGVVGAGAAAAMPSYFDGPAGGQGICPASPQSSGRRPIGRNEPILVDIGCAIEGYVIDQTRTVVIGQLAEDLMQAYELAEAILKMTESRLCPGVLCEDLYFQALEQVKQAGLEAHFMGFGADQVKFLGHGIGLEIDELPVLAKGFTQPLEQGMVIAVEPKFTFPGRGVVGIEDSYVITEKGWEKLSLSAGGLIVI